MKVYCVWAWDQYYPEGGERNLKGMYTTQEDAEKRLEYIKQHCSYDYHKMTTEFVGEAEDDYEDGMGGY